VGLIVGRRKGERAGGGEEIECRCLEQGDFWVGKVTIWNRYNGCYRGWRNGMYLVPDLCLDSR
jgi:hypothetical protein